MKRFLVAMILMFVLAQSALAGEKFLKSLDEAQKEAKAKQQLIFVDMFAQWCGWCHRMEQEVFPSEAFQKATDKMVLLRLNTEDGKEGTKITVSVVPDGVKSFGTVGGAERAIDAFKVVK